MEERRSVTASNDSVTDLVGVLAARSKNEIVPAERSVVIDSKSHGMRPAIRTQLEVPAMAVIDSLAAAGQFGRALFFEPLFRTDTAIGCARLEQRFDDFCMAGRSLRLTIRAFVPVDSEPSQPVENGQFRFSSGAFEVRILDAQHELTAVATGQGPIEECGPSTADMQKPRGARGESSSNSRHRGRAYRRHPPVPGESVVFLGGGSRAALFPGTRERYLAKVLIF